MRKTRTPNGRRWVVAAFGAIVALTSGLLVAGPASATSTVYYINNVSAAGVSCSDAGTGTSSAAPWCSVGAVNARTFGPGDTILLACGATWTQGGTAAADFMIFKDSGSAAAPITLDAYNPASPSNDSCSARPKVFGNGQPFSVDIAMTNPANWVIKNLEIGKTGGAGILLYYSTTSNQNITIDNVYAHEVSGVHRGNSGTDNFDCSYVPTHRIYESGGIVVTGNVAYTTSQYALSNVTISHFEGSHNQDSISFDWCNGNDFPTDQAHSTGANLVQNVTLNGLYLHDDDGNGVSGIQCSDSLRLFQMENVTIENAILNNEAACYADHGTAAVILFEVHNVNLVNSVLTNVPDTLSTDQAAIDHEGYYDSVNIRNNYFAGNAGPGMEYLMYRTIAGGFRADDYGTNGQVSGNWFYANSTAARGIFRGGIVLNGTPFNITSTIRDNLRAEPSGFLNYSVNGIMAGTTLAGNLDVTSGSAASSAHDFTNSTSGWGYQYTSTGTSWNDLQYTSDKTWGPNGYWTPTGAASTYPFVSQFLEHPADCATLNCKVARVWTAPATGTISVRARALKANTSCGDGAGITITKTTAANVVTTPFPRTLLGPTDNTGIETNVDLTVAAGDKIRFVVDDNGTNYACDWVSWMPNIGYTSGTSFVGAAQVGGELRNNFTGWVGLKVTTGSTARTVSQVGRYSAASPTSSHTVEIVDAGPGGSAGSVLGSAVVSLGAAVDGQGFAYGALSTPVTLAAGHSYYITSQETSGGDKWYGTNNLPIITPQDSGVTIVPAYNPDNLPADWVIGMPLSGNSYGPVNFKY